MFNCLFLLEKHGFCYQTAGRDYREQMAEFGKDLRRERETRGVALEAIAQGTKVSVRHLRALEEESFRDLPGGVFNKGILRAFVKFLELDEPDWVERFERCPDAGNT